MVFVPELVEWMRNGGETQYEPSPAPPRSLHARRKADRPPWMDRVWPRAAADEPLNGQT
jgi:hypothetical protein